MTTTGQEAPRVSGLEPAYGYAKAAEKLQALGYDVSEHWLRNHPEVPRVKVGHDVKFTDALLAEFIESKTQRAKLEATSDRPTGRRHRRTS